MPASRSCSLLGSGFLVLHGRVDELLHLIETLAYLGELAFKLRHLAFGDHPQEVARQLFDVAHPQIAVGPNPGRHETRVNPRAFGILGEEALARRHFGLFNYAGFHLTPTCTAPWGRRVLESVPPGREAGSSAGRRGPCRATPRASNRCGPSPRSGPCQRGQSAPCRSGRPPAIRLWPSGPGRSPPSAWPSRGISW